MAETGKLRVNLTDVRGRRIKEAVDVVLRHRTLSEVKKAVIKPGTAATITGLRSRPVGLYSVFIDPPSYHPVSQFVEVLSQDVASLDIVCAVDPRKVDKTKFPDFAALSEDATRVLNDSDAVLDFGGKTGKDLLAELDPIRKAGFLNIMAKSAATAFGNGRSAASYFTELLELRGDRFFVTVPKGLREETKNAVQDGLFEEVDGSLHHPPEGFSRAGSFKTRDHYGNLQLTFFAKDDEWRADVDIDDASGIEHVFQVVGNALSGGDTHPYNIQQLLLHYQKLDPGYDLLV